MNWKNNLFVFLLFRVKPIHTCTTINLLVTLVRRDRVFDNRIPKGEA